MRLIGLAVVLACGLTLAPPAALALQAGKVYRIGTNQLELLKTAVPGIRRVAVLFNNSQIGSVKFARDVELAAKTLGVQAYSINWDYADRLVSAFGEVKKVRADSLILGPNLLTIRHGGQVAELALKHRLPSMAVAGTVPERGGLMSYGPEQIDLYRRAAHYVDASRGALPSVQVDRPVRASQPSA